MSGMYRERCNPGQATYLLLLELRPVLLVIDHEASGSLRVDHVGCVEDLLGIFSEQ